MWMTLRLMRTYPKMKTRIIGVVRDNFVVIDVDYATEDIAAATTVAAAVAMEMMHQEEMQSQGMSMAVELQGPLEEVTVEPSEFVEDTPRKTLWWWWRRLE